MISIPMKEWEELASLLADEQNEKKDLLSRFMTADSHDTVQLWKELQYMNNQMEINVDKAWDRLSSRIEKSEAEPIVAPVKTKFLSNVFLRVAAITFVIVCLGSALFYLYNIGILSRRITIATDNSQMNLQVKLPDGSNIFLNRNTKLSYKSIRGKFTRHVTLSGEAFFDISPDASKPFKVYAGKAIVEVIGTSFNVISKNIDSAVEVFVKTGKVVLEDSSGSRNLVLDPGFVGIMGTKLSDKKLNINPNYMSWNTGKLIYQGQKLDVVFHDLKGIYNIDIITADPEILNLPLDATFNNEPHETIIRIICATFNLSYQKEGDIYYLKKK